MSVDFPRTANGIHSDEATYYMMGHSLAEDGDLTYRKEDLVRVWREFPSGPSGLFLKKGTDIVDAGLMRRPPFFWTATQDDPDPTRLFYGKSFAYPLAAAPFVKVFGTNGFLVLNALLMSLVRAVQLPVPARAHAGVDRGAPRRRVRAGQHRPGLLRLDRARSLQLRAGPARVFLLAVQGSRAAATCHAPDAPG